MATLLLDRRTAGGGPDARRAARGPRLAREIQRTYFSVCVAHRKGGVGKTTTTWYLSRELARAGMNVVLRDLDPQILRDVIGTWELQNPSSHSPRKRRPRTQPTRHRSRAAKSRKPFLPSTRPVNTRPAIAGPATVIRNTTGKKLAACCAAGSIPVHPATSTASAPHKIANVTP